MPTLLDPVAPALLLLDDPVALVRRWDILNELTRRQMLLSTSALALSLAGCGGSGEPAAVPTPSVKQIYHAFGVTDVPVPVQRLVVVDQAVTLEHVVALGVQPAGAPLDAPVVPHVRERLDSTVINTGASFPANIEGIAAAKPDLIIGWKEFMLEIRDQLPGIAATVATNRDGFGAWKDDLRFVADVLGRRARAEELIAEYDERVADLRERLSDYAGQTFCVFSTRDENVRIDGPDKSFPGPILTELGLTVGPREIAGGELNLISGQINFSLEFLPELESVDGWIFWPQEADTSEQDQGVESSPLWTELPAVREGRVAKVDRDAWLQGSVLSAHLVLDDIERLLLDEATPTATPDA